MFSPKSNGGNGIGLGLAIAAGALILSKSGKARASEKGPMGKVPCPHPDGVTQKVLRPVTNLEYPEAVCLTGYYPYNPSGSKHEGGTNDAYGHPLITLEMHLEDPERYPWVSLSRDPNWCPYGQLVHIEMLVKMGVRQSRFVDTGTGFGCCGCEKTIRIKGHDPVDVCVKSRNHPFKLVQSALKIVPGNYLDKKTGRPRGIPGVS